MGAKPKIKSDQKTEEKPTKQAISSAPSDLTSPQEEEIHHFPFQKKNFKLSLALKITLAFIFSGLLISLVFQLLSIKSTILRGIIPEMMILCLAPVLYFYCRHITQSLLQRNALLEQNDIKNQRINNIYHIITQVNHAVLRERSQEQLLYETCKIAQKSSDYTFVWAGICDDATN
ncbi:MAG: hypothetical protein AB7V32_10105, partial [Candidatus Berkiella sp.]